MTYDLIVVGGGPAGSAAARAAAREGASVLVLDAAAFPRSKPCGGALSEQAMSYLDFAVDPRLFHAEVFGARVHFREQVVAARKPFRIAVLTQRSELDKFLLDKAAEAGAIVRDRTRVTSIDEAPDSVCVHGAGETFCGKLVIGADGASGMTALRVRRRLSPRQYAVTFELDLRTRDKPPPEIADGFIDVYFGGEYMGYSWLFAKRDRWNIGVGALALQAPNVKKAALAFSESLDGLGTELGQTPENAVGWVVPVGGYRRTLGKGRLLLAGDAAGFVDPFYGEGIAYAILSGKTAGTLVGKARHNLDGSAPSEIQVAYLSFCRRTIDANLRYGLLFARLLHAWPGGLLRLFSTNESLIEKYLDVPAARISYGQYFRWFVPRAAVGLSRLAFQRRTLSSTGRP